MSARAIANRIKVRAEASCIAGHFGRVGSGRPRGSKSPAAGSQPPCRRCMRATSRPGCHREVSHVDAGPRWSFRGDPGSKGSEESMYSDAYYRTCDNAIIVRETASDVEGQGPAFSGLCTSKPPLGTDASCQFPLRPEVDSERIALLRPVNIAHSNLAVCVTQESTSLKEYPPGSQSCAYIIQAGTTIREPEGRLESRVPYADATYM